MDSEKNIYKDGIDFVELAAHDPGFARVLKPNKQLDFSDPEAVQQLTKSLLKRDFKLSLELPPDRLCPPVPNRLNYILFASDLLSSTAPFFHPDYHAGSPTVILDIGTGASAIYPLLGCTSYSNWKFIGTDADPLSLAYAVKNVKANNLSSRVHLVQTSQDNQLLPTTKSGSGPDIDMTICNPPFYANDEEMTQSAKAKFRPPSSACTGSPSEMVTAGGEIAFVTRIVDASLVSRENIRWYSSMLGKLSSLAPLVAKLKSNDITNYAITEFIQGNKTRRWALAWSFRDMRPDSKTSRGVKGSGIPKELLPFPTEYEIMVPVKWDVQAAMEKVEISLNKIVAGLPLSWQWKNTIRVGVGLASGDVWSRAARRMHQKRQQSENTGESLSDDSDEAPMPWDMPFAFKITVNSLLEATTSNTTKTSIKTSIRWLRGYDSVIFESFCGMLKRRLASIE